MKCVLLDTHAFWGYFGVTPEQSHLPMWLRGQIQRPDWHICISIVSIWELSIKILAGKLQLSCPLDALVDRAVEQGFEILPVNLAHIYQLMKLPLLHRDPFDRMIIAQGLAENIAVASKDNAFRAYPIQVVWE
jgi:PIN domain nuclease of toxin-antitoxin system